MVADLAKNTAHGGFVGAFFLRGGSVGCRLPIVGCRLSGAGSSGVGGSGAAGAGGCPIRPAAISRRRVREVLRRPALAGRCALAMDATGVGQPVLDMLRRANLGCSIAPVIITGGERESHERISDVGFRISGLDFWLERVSLWDCGLLGTPEPGGYRNAD